ncbi:phosphatidylinositol-specific phospholipase C domain-containing protein [Caulobacter sp. RL271]|uniref:Ca2+-dependent phosphoinositide-specific phospholipase C n=1 Tax=Caulobacter segnis TaxID=88688 RepID=A0ABY4ZX97_9CAUL|nr:phosphatidylinositol-specific phospholipase C domain-containing protein [Caulobacter segnis]USQ96597.1 Ca2+-dependent phosphoinositide-specific phospholipase C [Caulobacter segnis]
MRPSSLAVAFSVIALAAPMAVRAAEAPKINALRWLGSHNSYRPELDPAALAHQRQVMGERSRGVEYGHPPIRAQLDLGVRQLEFDPYADTTGGLYAAPYADDPAKAAIMKQPGAKVLHAPVIDNRTLCLRLSDCFAEVASWSRAHPGHQPIVIFVNTKEEPFNTPAIPNPPLWTQADFAGIDADAVKAFGRDRIITPDDVRGDRATLRDGVTGGGWPTIESAKGKVLLVLDANPRIEDAYRAGHPSLKGRVLFGLYVESEPEAAVFNIQDPRPEEARIKALVAQGFLVRTRSDADTTEARNHDLGRLEVAVRSGAQIVSTDYYPGAPDPLGLKFEVRPSWFGK